MTLERRLLNIALIFTTIVVVGVVGYMVIEGWSWIDAFYMAIITVTTVGFGEVHPLTSAGRLFTSALVVLGVAAITYSFTALANYLIAGELGDVLEEFRMKRKIESSARTLSHLWFWPRRTAGMYPTSTGRTLLHRN